MLEKTISKEDLAGGVRRVVGAALRYLAGLAAARIPGALPWGTLLVNLAGCFVMGFITGWLFTGRPERESLRLFLATGMLGGFTTFSAFSLETFQFIQDGRWGLALLYVLLTAVGCLLGVSLGNGTASLLS